MVAFKVFFLFFLTFVINGIVLQIDSSYFFGVNAGDLAHVTCLFAFAWIAGYMLPGAPAGFGLREVTLIYLLSPSIGEGNAIALSLMLRIISTLSDFIALLIGFLLKKINLKAI